MSDAHEEALRQLPLAELRQLVEDAQQVLFDRRCQSRLNSVGDCKLQPPHEDGWHETTETFGVLATPSHNGPPERVTVRWRFSDEVVEREHAHEARRRPGAN